MHLILILAYIGDGKIAEASGKFACIRMVDLLEKPGKYDVLRFKGLCCLNRWN